MSFFTQADRDYVNASLEKIRAMAFKEGRCLGIGDRAGADRYRHACDEELARLKAFADGCTLEKGKGGE